MASRLQLAVFAGATLLAVCLPSARGPAPEAVSQATREQSARLAGLPIRFEPVSGDVGYVARGPGYGIHLRAGDEMLLALAGDGVLSMRLGGADPSAALEGVDPLPGLSHYLIGDDPAAWRTDVPQFARVRCVDAYPGVDVEYYGRGGHLEYDFVVAPGADPGAIRIAFGGASAELDDRGRLVANTARGCVVQHAPVAYQDTDRGRVGVDCRYVDRGGEVALAVGTYDAARALVIDPELVYSTYVGGDGFDGVDEEALPGDGERSGFKPVDVVVDEHGYTYVAAVTSSHDFPGAEGPDPSEYDTVVFKLTPDGSSLVYSTYIGGRGHDFARGIGIDALGNVYVCGSTGSSDFPLSNPLPFPGGEVDRWNAFVFSLDVPGSALRYSTYLGGTGIDQANDLAVKPNGEAIVVGGTWSEDFPVTPGAFQPLLGATDPPPQWPVGDAWVVNFAASGGSLLYATYLGGSAPDVAGAVAVDDSGRLLVVGSTESPDFPIGDIPGAGDEPILSEAFVVRLDGENFGMSMGTLIGGSERDHGLNVGLDEDGHVFVAGSSNSTDFPFVNALRTTQSGGEYSWTGEGFLAKLDADTAQVQYSTFVGGAGREFCCGLVVTPEGTATVTGMTDSDDLPTVDPLDGPEQGSNDAYVLTFAPDGQTILFGTYLAGSEGIDIDDGYDVASAVAIGPDGALHVVGATMSIDFPVTAGAFQGSLYDARYQSDVFVTKISGKSGPPPGTIRSFLLPTKLTVATGVVKAGKPRVKAAGIFDTGPDTMVFTAAAEVRIGPNVLQIPGLSQMKGRKERYRYEGQGLDLMVTPSKLGTSKAKFTLKYSGEFTEAVGPNDVFALRYTGSVADAKGVVQLDNGKFRFARKAGLLLEPELDIRKAKAKLPGVGRHRFKFVAGFTTEGVDPPTPPDCTVQFGNLFSASMPGDAFRRKGKNWVLGQPVGGVTNAILSFPKERITVKGKDVELGSVPEGPAPLLLVMTMGDDERAVLVRAVRKKKIFKY